MTVATGDYSGALKNIVTHLGHAAQYTSNAHQAKTIEQYINHFMHGDVAYHKKASEHWVKDDATVVESYLGFVETDRDPSGRFHAR